MSEVTVIGLGNMGTALARAFTVNGHSMTVWNRSPEKAAPLVEKGAVLAGSPAAAAAASPIIILCVTNYEAAQHILNECGAGLSGKLLVQLSTGTPQDARDGEAWAQKNGVDYLEGKITGSPSSIGTPAAHILLSGPEDVFRKAEPLLQVLARKLDYKGEDIGLSSAWDMVLIMHYYGMFISLMHSVHICQAEEVPLEQFSSLLSEQGKGYEQWLVDNIRSGSYSETSAPLELWAGGIRNIAQHAQESRINAAFPMLVSELFQKAMAAGYGREEVSALFKVLSSSLGKGKP